MLCNQAAGAALSGGKREPPPQQEMCIRDRIKLSRTSRLSMEYILLGDVPQEQDLTPLQAMLARCTPRELHLAEKVLQLFLLRGDI